MEFYIPTETGEFLAFCAAAAMGLFGLFAMTRDAFQHARQTTHAAGIARGACVLRPAG